MKDKKPATPPARWPRVHLAGVGDLPRGMQEAAFWSALERSSLEDAGVRLSRRGCCAPWVTAEGFLDAPATVCDTQTGQRHLLYYYPEPTPEAAAHFTAVQAAASAYGAPEPIYYASEMLPEVSDETPLPNVIASNDPRIRALYSPPFPGPYAIWWSKEDEAFTTSPLFPLFKTFLQKLNHLHYPLAVELAERAKAVRPNAKEIYRAYVVLPGNFTAILSYGPETGTAIHFNRATTPPSYRDAYLAFFMNWAIRWAENNRPNSFNPTEPDAALSRLQSETLPVEYPVYGEVMI